MEKNSLPKNFFNILKRAVEGKIYGSIEIYLEEGKVTQITQRIINKIKSKPKKPNGESLARTI